MTLTKRTSASSGAPASVDLDSVDMGVDLEGLSSKY
jgi:hypothetical protein